MNPLLMALLAWLAVTAYPMKVAAAESQSEKVMLVLDASGSMWGKVDGLTKIEIARSVVADLVAEWDPAVELGLSAYGHRRKGDCADIETLIPVGEVHSQAVLEAVNGLLPKGKTPLGQAVRLAAEELRYTEEAATVILVSDGVETCDADPCALGEELEGSGVDFTAHVIGFDLDDDDSSGLRCLAERTAGNYFGARDATTLLAALRKAVEEVAPPAEPPAPVESQRTFPIQSGCQGTGLLCEPAYPIPVTTRGTLRVQFNVSSIHCGPIKIFFTLDDEPRHESVELGAGGQEPVSTKVVDLGPVEPGEHTIGLQALGIKAGCIEDSLSSWAGSVTLWNSE